MHAKGLVWVGTQTDRFVEMRTFVEALVGAPPSVEEDGFALFELPNRDRVEIFGDSQSGDPSYTWPVASFLVDDVHAAREQLETLGAALIGDIHVLEDGYSWLHFRAPDGRVYAVTHRPGHPALAGREACKRPVGDVHAKGLVWLGTQTDDFRGMRDFVERLLGTPPAAEQPGFAMFELPNGDRAEVFGDSGTGDPRFTWPVVGFLVADIERARAELERRGIEFLGPIETMEDGYAWSHFRAPDGRVYELTRHPTHPAASVARE